MEVLINDYLIVEASIPSNMFVIKGHCETKPMTDFLPNILNQLGPESLERLRKYAESIGVTPNSGVVDDDDDDDVPELVENFEDAANK